MTPIRSASWRATNLAQILWKSIPNPKIRPYWIVTDVSRFPSWIGNGSLYLAEVRKVDSVRFGCSDWGAQLPLLSRRQSKCAILGRRIWPGFQLCSRKARISYQSLLMRRLLLDLLDKELGKKDYIAGGWITVLLYCYLGLGMGSWCRISYPGASEFLDATSHKHLSD